MHTQLRRDTYSRLTPVQRLQVARHPNRPTFLDVALNITVRLLLTCHKFPCVGSGSLLRLSRQSRPTNICAPVTQDKFVELHGDRGGLDDPAMVCGIGSMDGVSFMFIGHQKGRNTKVLSCLVQVAGSTSS